MTIGVRRTSGKTMTTMMLASTRYWLTRLHRRVSHVLSILSLAGATLFASAAEGQVGLFADVDYAHPFRPHVETFYYAGYTGGCASNPLRYCPHDPVTRSQSAVFLVRETRGVQSPPLLLSSPFTDVAGHLFAQWIATAHADGLVESTAAYDGSWPSCVRSPTNYCPDAPLTRSEMAKALLRAKFGRNHVPPPAVGEFADLPANDPRAPWAEQLKALGITSGCASAPLRYCPGDPVTRMQTAVFFTRAFNMPPLAFLVATEGPYSATALTTYTLNATASDPDDQVGRIEVHAGSTLVCNVPGAAATCTWTAPLAGTLIFRATAHDTRGKSRYAEAPVVVPNRPPTIALTSPTGNQSLTVPATLTVAANATDIDGGIVRVNFFANNVLLVSDQTAPYSHTYSPPRGVYDIYAEARDAANGSARTPTLRVTVANPPSIAFTLPAAGQVAVPGSVVTIDSNAASDYWLGRGVARVDYTARNAQGTVVWTHTRPGCNPPPGQICIRADPWKTTWTLPAGSARYDLTGTVVDTDGVQVSAQRSFVAGVPPIVSVVSDRAVYTSPATVRLTATASDPDGGTVTQVEFRANGTSIGLGTRSGNTFTLAWTTSAQQVHTVVAIATDNLGLSTTSAPITFEVIAPGPRTVYYHNDLAGSPIAATNANGTVIWHESYAPYGERWAPTSTVPNGLWFTGKPTEDATGLSYLGGRWYNPTVGRFYSVDPKRFDESNPHSFNRYAYANNNPYRFVDPDGHSPVDIGFLLWDLGKLGVALYTGAGVGAAATDVLISTIGVASPVPGTGLALKAARGVDRIADVAKATDGIADVAKGTEKAAHGNKIDSRPATLYEKYDKDGNFLKHGVTKHEDPAKRYTANQIDGGTVVRTDCGPRCEMIKKERDLVERRPGPENREPWAGKRLGE